MGSKEACLEDRLGSLNSLLCHDLEGDGQSGLDLQGFSFYHVSANTHKQLASSEKIQKASHCETIFPHVYPVYKRRSSDSHHWLFFLRLSPPNVANVPLFEDQSIDDCPITRFGCIDRFTKWFVLTLEARRYPRS